MKPRTPSWGILVLSVFLIQVGCSLEQDPLKKYPDHIRNAKPPLTKPDIPEPTKSEAIRIDAPDVVSFKEGEKGGFRIGFRLLLPDFEGALEISNLKFFPGAEYDATTGEFSWTPPGGLVVDAPFAERELILRVVATPTEESKIKVPLANERTVKVVIFRSVQAPLVRTIEVVDGSKMLREGKVYRIQVVVEDGSSGSANNRPNVIFEVPHSPVFNPVKYLGGFMRLDEIKSDANNPGRWIFRYDLTLLNEEVTSSYIIGGFDVYAQSAAGVRSPLLEFRIPVLTELSKPISMAPKGVLKFPVGVSSRIEFVVFDPKLEGRLTLGSVSGLPDGARFECSHKDSISVFMCSLTWRPKQADTSVRSIDYEIRSANRDSRDSQVLTEKFSLKYTAEGSGASVVID